MSDGANRRSKVVLQDHNARRTSELYAKFRGSRTAHVHVDVVGEPSTYGALTRVRIEVPRPPRVSPIRISYPTSMQDGVVLDRSVASLSRVTAEIDGRPSRVIARDVRDATLVEASRSPWSREPQLLTVAMELDGAFVQLARADWGEGWQLALELEIDGVDRCLVRLTHDADIALRARVDDADYHSLAESVGSRRIRKTGFHSSNSLFMMYRYGLADEKILVAWAFPALVAAFGLFAAGLSLAFFMGGHEDLAATGLAFALLPPLAQAGRQAASRYGSSDIRRFGPAAWLLWMPVVLYVPSVGLALLAMTDWSKLQRPAQVLCYIASAVLVTTGAALTVAVKQQVIPLHYCDRCMCRIWWRRQRRLDLASRRTLCSDCFKGVSDDSA